MTMLELTSKCLFSEAIQYHEDVINFNEFGWIYIIGVVLIIFLVLGCCICLCRLGEDKAIPAASKGYQVSNIDKLESTRMFYFPSILFVLFRYLDKHVKARLY